MRFYKHLYVSDSIQNINRVKWKLKHNAGQIHIYVIALAENKVDQLEIYHCALLQQKFYHKKEHGYIVGITTSYEEALEIVQKIVTESLEATGQCNVREYLQNKTD